MNVTPTPELEAYWPFALTAINRDVLHPMAPTTVQKDGQKVLNALRWGEPSIALSIYNKYIREAGRGQGGSGAGPGKVKSPRRGVMMLVSVAEKAFHIMQSQIAS
jgi:hypothetical protein